MEYVHKEIFQSYQDTHLHMLRQFLMGVMSMFVVVSFLSAPLVLGQQIQEKGVPLQQGRKRKHRNHPPHRGSQQSVGLL